jgi:hypothetical protein
LKLLTVEQTDSDVLHIHLNAEGAAELINILKQLSSSPVDTHEHLATPNWGGTELTESLQSDKSRLIHQLNLHFWT